MAEVSDVYGILYENLVDAGCSEKGIAVCMDYAKKVNGNACKQSHGSSLAGINLNWRINSWKKN